MIHPIRYHGWLVCAALTISEDERTTQTGLLPWGTRYTTPASHTTISKENDQPVQDSEGIQRHNRQVLTDATPEASPIIGTKEVAIILNISVRQVQRLVKRNKLPPPIPHNKKLLWVEYEFHKWMNDAMNRKGSCQ